MDDKSLHDLLNGALAGEPPLGPVAQNALAAGIGCAVAAGSGPPPPQPPPPPSSQSLSRSV